VDSYEDINIPQNVISRFDLIIDLPGDLERRLKPMEEAFAEGTVLSSQMVEARRPAGQRQLQLLVAYMRAHWREVRVPPDVNAYIFNRVKQEFGLVKGGSPALGQRVLEGSIARTARSVHKLIKAIACADHKLTATKEDVDRALVFIRAKVHFLSTYREINPAPLDPRKRRIHDRLENILQAFGRKEFTTSQAEAIQGAAADGEGAKTIRQRVMRDIALLVAAGRLERVRHGTWRVKAAGDPKEPQKHGGGPAKRRAAKHSPVSEPQGRRRGA
jgi:DNA replicative helicase MCM subunit Mcm2 (Cdc46/Mcm family)